MRELTSRGDEFVLTRCAYPECGKPFNTFGGPSIRCPQCLRPVAVFSNGFSMRYSTALCPQCSISNYYHPDGQRVECCSCGSITIRHIDSSLVLIPGVDCPYCDERVDASRSGLTRCKSCGNEIAIDADSKLAGRVAHCLTKSCIGTMYFPRWHGSATCSECNRGVKLSGSGKVEEGFELSCSACYQDMYTVDNPLRFVCGCGVYALLNSDGQVIEHSDIVDCPVCEESYVPRPGVNLCPRCGVTLAEHSFAEQAPWNDDNNHLVFFKPTT